MSTGRWMAILAHPDDESLALGGTLAKYGRRESGQFAGVGTVRRAA